MCAITVCVTGRRRDHDGVGRRETLSSESETFTIGNARSRFRESLGIAVDDRYRDVGCVRKYTRVLRAPVAVSDDCKLEGTRTNRAICERSVRAVIAVGRARRAIAVARCPHRVTPISLCVAPAQRDYRDGYGTWRIECVQEAVRPDLHPDSDYPV